MKAVQTKVTRLNSPDYRVVQAIPAAEGGGPCRSCSRSAAAIEAGREAKEPVSSNTRKCFLSSEHDPLVSKVVDSIRRRSGTWSRSAKILRWRFSNESFVSVACGVEFLRWRERRRRRAGTGAALRGSRGRRRHGFSGLHPRPAGEGERPARIGPAQASAEVGEDHRRNVVPSQLDGRREGRVGASVGRYAGTA